MVAPELRLDARRTTNAFGCALGANPTFYGQFEQNARNWYTRIQETACVLQPHVVNRRSTATSRRTLKDVYIKLEKRPTPGLSSAVKSSQPTR